MLIALLTSGAYGLGLNDQLSSSGWDDPGSASAQAEQLSESVFGRDHTADVLVLYTAPSTDTSENPLDNPEFSRKITDNLNSLPQRYPDEIAKVNGAYWETDTGVALPGFFSTADKRHAFASIAIRGNTDTEMARNYREVKDAFAIPGVDVEVAGGQAVAGALTDTMTDDLARMEVIAIPVVAVLLVAIFGGVVAASLPLLVGGLTVLAAWGVIRLITNITEVNSFVAPVVSMIGLGLAIDYGLFIVSRFREELAEGKDVAGAVDRTVQTAGRTVAYSAAIVIGASSGLLLFPQGFLRSFAYGAIVTVALAALTALTLLPAMLSILGHRVDLLGFQRLRASRPTVEATNGPWGRSVGWVMKHSRAVAVSVCAVLALLMFPAHSLAFGSVSERFLPPDHPTRTAQEHFDELFPLRQPDPVQLLLTSQDPTDADTVRELANRAPGLAGPFSIPIRGDTRQDVFRSEAILAASAPAGPTIDYLRSMDLPDGATLLVGGQPAIERDSIDALLDRMPLMIALVLLATTVLMWLIFGSLTLSLKTALMNTLGLGSTLGILTWIFIDGHGAGLLNFTPQPMMPMVLVVIAAIVYGLSTDYQVFLLSRIVEARAAGVTTTEAVRVGIAQTGRIITAAALVLVVVTGAFAFSELLMMKYIAFGLIAALVIDVALIRMLLVPAAMTLLGDRCWWSPITRSTWRRSFSTETVAPPRRSAQIDIEGSEERSRGDARRRVNTNVH